MLHYPVSMKRIFAISLPCLLALAAWAIIPPKNHRIHANNAFQKGEFVKYRVHYGPITAGYATVLVSNETAMMNGRKCHKIIGEGYTAPSYDWIFKVRDHYESYMDEESLFSWKFKRKIDESNFHTYTETYFDQENRKVNFIGHDQKQHLYDTDENMQDPMSAFFYARAHYDHTTLKVGDKISLKQFESHKTIPLEAKLLKREVIEIEGVKYKTLKFDLMVGKAGLITDDSDIKFWLSDDENKIILRTEMRLYFGAIRVDMMAYSGLKHSFAAKL